MRPSKVRSLAEAVELVTDGSRLALGGVLHANRPAAFVRALVRQRVRGLSLFSAPTSGWDADLLVGTECVAESFLAMVTMGRHGLAPSFRAAVENGAIAAHNLDALSLTAGYLAAGYRHPYHLVLSLEGTDLVDDQDLFVTLTGPNDVALRAVRALPVDVAVLHAEEADEWGNLRHGGGRASDLLLARAATVTIAQVERVVSHEEVMRAPAATTVSAQWVDIVVEVPHGAHPTGTSHYAPDDDHLAAYVDAARRRVLGDPEPYQRYLAEFVDGPADLEAYLGVVGKRRLAELTYRSTA